MTVLRRFTVVVSLVCGFLSGTPVAHGGPGPDPIGNFDSATVVTGGVRLTAWAFDPSRPTAQASVMVARDGAGLGIVGTPLIRPDVNAAFGITGPHGLSILLTPPMGIHKLCLTAFSLDGSRQAAMGCKTVKLTLGTLAILKIPYSSAGLAIDPRVGAVYSANADNTMTVIDSATSVVTGTVAAGLTRGSAAGIALNEALGTAYVSNYVDGTVTSVNTSTFAQATISLGGGNPRSLAFDARDSKLYVADDHDHFFWVVVINPVSGSAISVAEVDIGDTGSYHLAVDPDEQRLFVVSSAGAVVAVDTTSDRVMGRIAVGPRPAAAAVDPRSHRLYVANSGDGTVSTIDTVTGSVLSTVAVGPEPAGLAVDPTSQQLYVTHSDSPQGTLSVHDATSLGLPLLQTLILGNMPIHVACNNANHRVYVANINDSTITVLG